MGFTPDNQTFIYSTNEYGEFSQAWTLSLETGERAPLITDDWDVMYVGYSPSGRYQVSGVNNDASTDVSLIDLQTGEAVVLNNVPAGDLAQVRFNRDETAIAFGLNRDTAPYDLYYMPSAVKRRVSQLRLIPRSTVTSWLRVRWCASRATMAYRCQGILYQPREASVDNPAPALVWVHGGPGGQSRKGTRR